MVRLRIVFAAVLAASLLAVVAGPAHGVAPSKNTKFCNALSHIPDAKSSAPTKQQAKQSLQGFKNAAKYAPAKVRSAIDTIVKYLGIVADADRSDLEDLAKSGDIRNYPKAFGAFVKYYSANCIPTS